MELENAIRKRRSIRKYKPTSVPEDTVREILDLARLAPSAGNLQAFRVLVVTDDEGKQKLIDATYTKLSNVKQGWVFDAPVILVICAETEESAARFGERGKDTYSVQDATIFAAYLQLIITSHGLDSGWIGNVEEQAVKEAFDLPDQLRIVALIPFGHADDGPNPFERKDLDDLLIH